MVTEQQLVQDVKQVAEKAKEYFVLEKDHLQTFLNYLAAKPYSEVVELIEKMKQARAFVPTPVTSPEPVTPPAPATDPQPVVVPASDANLQP